MEKSDWQNVAKNLLKAELKKRGLSYADLHAKLEEVGVNESLGGIKVKLSRGTFSAVFLLQCLSAIGCENLRIESALFKQE